MGIVRAHASAKLPVWGHFEVLLLASDLESVSGHLFLHQMSQSLHFNLGALRTVVRPLRFVAQNCRYMLRYVRNGFIG